LQLQLQINKQASSNANAVSCLPFTFSVRHLSLSKIKRCLITPVEGCWG